jgi:flagellar basal body-associated protein FliL
MAIVVSEENSSSINWLAIILWLVILAAGATAFYYVFFKNPEVVDIVISPSAKDFQKLAEMNIDPASVLNSEEFKSLKPANTVSSSANYGKTNPFLPVPIR